MEKEYFDLTAPQKSIWLTEQYYSNTNINNVCGTFYSSEKLDFEVLKKSLNIFLKNNDSFKIKLCFTNDEIKQYFSEIEDIDFEIVNIKNKEEQTALENKVASKVFHLIDSFLFEIVLFKYPDNSGGFVINSHHIIADSWSNSLVANEVALIYDKVKNNQPYEKSKELSYKAYLDAEKNYLNSSKFEKDKQYWEGVFSTVPEVATIPTVKNNEKDEDLSANRLLLNVDSKLLSTIQSYCEKNKISLFNFFMAVFALYLGRVSNLDEFVIGTPILNRTNFKEKQTTGMFINTLPLKINLMHDKTFIENLKDIAINSMALLRHQKYSYQYIIEDLRKKDSNLPMLYNILYSYQITKMNENMDALNHTTSWTFNKTIYDNIDIHMFEWNESNTINIAYDYRTSKYNEQDILDLHARILHIIKQILENETILLKDIEIVTPEEKHKILYEFNNTKTDYPKDKTIAQVFEEQVTLNPNKPAIVFENKSLTYQEFNQKANQLARYLKEQGVNSQDKVVILADKSIDLYVSIIAILKLGALYVPVDSEYPQERIDKIIQDCMPKLIVVDEKYQKLVKNEKHCIIPLLNLKKYSDKNLENIITSRRRSLYYLHFWFYRKPKRCSCSSSWSSKISN